MANDRSSATRKMMASAIKRADQACLKLRSESPISRMLIPQFSVFTSIPTAAVRDVDCKSAARYLAPTLERKRFIRYEHDKGYRRRHKVTAAPSSGRLRALH